MRLFLDKYLFKTVIDIARSLIIVVIDLLIVTLCIQYFYAALGFELFGSTHVNKLRAYSDSSAYRIFNQFLIPNTV